MVLLLHDVLVMCSLCDQTGQREERDEVREYHQAVEQVGQVPDQINVQRGADHDAGNNDRGVSLDRLVAEQRLYVLLTEEIPADNGGKREEQHADRNKCAADRAEGGGEGSLCELGALQAVRSARIEHAGGQDDHRGQRQYNKGVDEYGNDGDLALILRTLYLATRLYALASLVILSNNITTSLPCSTSLFALSITISATFA